MRFSPLSISRTMQVVIVFIIAAVAATPPSGATAKPGHGSQLRPLTSPTSSCGPSSSDQIYCYEIVDYNSSDNNYVTGINNHQDIDGAYNTGGGSYGSFAATNANSANALTPYTTFTPESDGSLSTYLSGLDDGSGGSIPSLFQVGYVVQPLLSETEGAVLNSGTWTLMRDLNEGGGTCAVTHLVAIFDSRIGVGFYETSSGTTCIKHAFEVYSNQNFTSPYTFVDLTPTDPSGSTTDVTSSVANGINILGDVVGTVTWTNGKGTAQTGGWIYRDLQYTTFCYAGGGTTTSCSSSSAAPTFANGINFSDVVVGNYTDQYGQHGFAITDPMNAGSTFTTIDTNQTNTVLWSINEGTGSKSEFFTGWTTTGGANALASGIVGICLVKAAHCSGSALRRSPDRLNGRRKIGRP
jgi:hypothetical protein